MNCIMAFLVCEKEESMSVSHDGLICIIISNTDGVLLFFRFEIISEECIIRP